MVDNEPDVRWLVRIALEVDGDWQVTEASTASAAMELAVIPPDVVIMDLGLTGGGVALIDHFRALVPRPGIVVFTGKEDVVPEVHDHGADGYVLKNGDIDMLLSTVSSLSKGSVRTASFDLGTPSRSAQAVVPWVAAQCETWGCSAVMVSAIPIVELLVSNLCEYADGPGQLGLRVTPHNFRMHVSDAGTGAPDLKHFGGHYIENLVAIDARSDAWGIRSTAEGRVVWSEIGLHVVRR